MEAYSLYEVNQYIKRVIALNFNDSIWVECEINQISEARGNHYLELIEKDEGTDNILAKSSATIWYRQFLFIKKKLGKQAAEILSPGIKVKLKVSVEYSERYGLSLNIHDIDPAFTFGQFELNRQKIIERLIKNDLLERNRQLQVPTVIQNIAVISSETAAGYQDFSRELLNNGYDYDFNVILFHSAMQGQNTEREVCMALDSISDAEFDIAVLIRGGGSKLDLASFDNYEISERIARMRIPVITGIGHEIDQTICDLVSHTSLKTPTAVAGFILDHNSNFEANVEDLLREITDLADWHLYESASALNRLQSQLESLPMMLLGEKRSELKALNNEAFAAALRIINEKKQSLDHKENLIELLDPRKVLKRGYSLVKSGKKYIARKTEFSGKEDISIEFYDGEINLKDSYGK